jgi:hypothetical protein
MTSHDVPSPILQLAQQCVAHVENSVGIALDYSTETLPILDHYCRTQRDSSQWPQGSRELAREAGAYFGEVLRRLFPCRWHVVDDALHEWRLEFEDCLLCFNPLGMVLELLLEGEALGWNAGFITDPAATAPLDEYLAGLPGVCEDDFFALTVRQETLDIVHDFLLRWQSRPGHRPPVCGPDDYAELVAAQESPIVVQPE